MKRSTEKELIDLGPQFYSAEEYDACLTKLFTINKLLGFFTRTVRLLKGFPKDAVVVDMGCGGGLFLLHLSKKYPDMKLLGIDVSAEAISVAQNKLQIWQQQHGGSNIEFELHPQDNFQLQHNSVDISLLTLVCHHLDDEDLVYFLQKIYQSTRKMIIIHDLQRHLLFYWWYKIWSPILFRNRLITHDGLISIKRSFTKNELKLILQKANITDYQIKWRFPFCWSIIVRKAA